MNFQIYYVNLTALIVLGPTVRSSFSLNGGNRTRMHTTAHSVWGVLTHEVAAKLRTKHNELVQSFENDGFNEIDAKKQVF